jgi:hypothetical protein
LRRAEQLDTVGELLAALVLTTAELVDRCMLDMNDVPAYQRAACCRGHLAVIAELRAATAVAGDQAWLDLLETAATPPIVGR